MLCIPPGLSRFKITRSSYLAFSFNYHHPGLVRVVSDLTSVTAGSDSLFIPVLLPRTLRTSNRLRSDDVDTIGSRLLRVLRSRRNSSVVHRTISRIIDGHRCSTLVPRRALSASRLVRTLTRNTALRTSCDGHLLCDLAGSNVALCTGNRHVSKLSRTTNTMLIHLTGNRRLGDRSIASISTSSLDR